MPELYHVLNRGVDKRIIFLDKQDHLRFIHDLYEFNDTAPAINLNFGIHKRKGSAGYTSIGLHHVDRTPLVDIHAFSLMPNHYHLLLSSRVENGISLFMKKLNGGYAKYFNERYGRSGALFQGKYKSVPITAQAHFIHLPYYIHFNPLDMFDHNWRNRAITNPATAMQFLEQYRWSSHLDYLGKKNFSSVTRRDFLLDFFGGTDGYKRAVLQWIEGTNMQDIRGLTLEE